MPTNHKVQPGEYLAQIAARYGITDYRQIWDDPHNAALKVKRPSPNVLNPGDVLFIPDRREKDLGRSTTQVHNFQVDAGPVKLQIVVHDVGDKPVGGAQGRLSLGKRVLDRPADGAGTLEYDLSLDDREGLLKLTAERIAEGQRDVPLVIGGLDALEPEPFDPKDAQRAARQKAAWQNRLNNLGYFAGVEPTDEEPFRWALQEFQCEHMGKDNSSPAKKPSGVADAETADALRKAHGA